jgi:chromosome segregation ATPase
MRNNISTKLERKQSKQISFLQKSLTAKTEELTATTKELTAKTKELAATTKKMTGYEKSLEQLCTKQSLLEQQNKELETLKKKGGLQAYLGKNQ